MHFRPYVKLATKNIPFLSFCVVKLNYLHAVTHQLNNHKITKIYFKYTEAIKNWTIAKKQSIIIVIPLRKCVTLYWWTEITIKKISFSWLWWNSSRNKCRSKCGSRCELRPDLSYPAANGCHKQATSMLWNDRRNNSFCTIRNNNYQWVSSVPYWSSGRWLHMLWHLLCDFLLSTRYPLLLSHEKQTLHELWSRVLTMSLFPTLC